MSIHDDEFPDPHDHLPLALSNDTYGVFVTDDEGRHYWMEVKVTSEGVIVDVWDRYGEECLATWARTFDEIGGMAFRLDPMT